MNIQGIFRERKDTFDYRLFREIKKSTEYIITKELDSEIKKVLAERDVLENDAVMFDIDDTLIFSDGRKNTPVLNLLEYARELKYKIVLVTARHGYEATVERTKLELADANISYDILAFAAAEDKTLYKKLSPYTYILSVGDMFTDLTDSMYYLKINRTV